MNDLATSQGTSLVETLAGRVRGTTVEGVVAFKSIPYGAPTSGANRFMPPRKPTPWAGVRDALEYQGHAPQHGLRPASRPELADFSGAPDTSPETEDCLTLNVWTPGLDHSAKRPVMVWFHGGAFSYGTANVARLQGSRLATRGDVVVVTVNQRLNIFGFLDLSAVGGADFSASGNAGTLDMIAALEWVRENIARFGGDPDNVTIFGESGGGGKVCTLLTMPSAHGLFHRAIVQSGAAIRLREPDRAARLTDAVLKTLGLTSRDLGRLQSLPMEQLLAAVEPALKAIGPAPLPLFDRYPFGPVVDGTIVPQHPFDQGAPAVSADIPLLIGDMKDEMASFLARDDKVWFRTLTEQEMHDRVAAVAGKHTDKVIETYRHLYPSANAAERLIATLTDSNFRIRSLIVAEHKAKQAAAPVYMYSFEWETPVQGGRLKAPHALDVPFTFDTIDLTNATDRSEAAHRLATAMSGTWAAFAHTGVPEHASIPRWPAYDLASRATLMLDAECRIENDPRSETRQLWQTITGR
ncbi:MAG: carboxylesterase/lipase family protein [Acetobacteraceae bacterium]